MKNLTLRVDEKTLERARRVAAERSTSVNALIRDYLAELASAEDEREKARARILEFCKNSKARIGPEGITWKREDLYDR